MGKHYILIVPKEADGTVPPRAIAAALSFREWRETEANEADSDEVNGEASDWTALAMDSSEASVQRLRLIMRDAVLHQRRSDQPCRIIVVYLCQSPITAEELSLLRSLRGGSVVVHVFSSQCPGWMARSLRCLQHVRLHTCSPSLDGDLVEQLDVGDGEMAELALRTAMEEVWLSARRQVPADLRSLAAIARLLEMWPSSRQLADTEDTRSLLQLARSHLPQPVADDDEVVAGLVLDLVLASCAPLMADDIDAELLLEAGNQLNRVASSFSFEEQQLQLSDSVPKLLSLQTQLAELLTACPLVSVRLQGHCAGRFAGLLLAAVPASRLQLQEVGFAVVPQLQLQIVKRAARFAALLQHDEATGSWRIHCFRLDEADDCREVVRALLRLADAGCDCVQGSDWSSCATVSQEILSRISQRLLLPAEFGQSQFE